MKKVFFGPALLNGMVSNKEKDFQKWSTVYVGTTSPLHGNFISGGPRGHFKLEIYSGQEFVDTDDSHKLISFEVNSYSEDQSKSGFRHEFTSSGLLLTLGISNIGCVATNNGRATWFRYFNVHNPLVCIEGTVGRVGSDADLIVTDDVILSGNSYKCFGFKLLISNSIFVVGS